jgi:N-carbamoylputrescine amidase
MHVALAVNRVTSDQTANLATVVALADEAADAGAALVVFPETALTGFIHTGDPVHDLPLGQAIPGAVTEELAWVARGRSLHLAIGLLEREGEALYDTALFFAPDGRIALKYRRISPQWRRQGADPAIYRLGVDLPVVATALGRCAFLLCGDLFDDTLIARVRRAAPDWLLCPFARGFDSDVHDEQGWHGEEVDQYAARAARAGVTTFLVNYVSDLDGAFGGALAIAGDGTILATSPLHGPGLSLVTV